MTDNAGANDKARTEFFALCSKLGAAHGEGNIHETMGKFAFAVAEAAANGVTSLDVDPTDKMDDVARAYNAMIVKSSKKAVHEHTALGTKANISKARQIHVAAAKTTCDFLDTMGKAREERTQMQKAGTKVQAVYAAIVSLARAQKVKDDDLTEEERKACIIKPAAPDPDLERMIEALQKKMAGIITGDCGVKSQAPELVQAEELIRTLHDELKQLREKQEAYEKLRALGVVIPETTPDLAEAA